MFTIVSSKTKVLLDYIKTRDTIAKPSAEKLHFNQDQKIKTLLGGILTFLIEMYMIYLIITNTIKMLNFRNPYITQIHGKFQYELETVSIDKFSKTVLEIWEGTGTNYDEMSKTVPLDRDSRRYIRIKVRNSIRSWQDGKKLKEDIYYDLERCTEDFLGTEFERAFYQKNKDEYQYCLMNNQIYMQGTMRSEKLKLPHAFIVYEVERCQDA